MNQAPAQPPVTFGRAIATALRKYADFDGRATRPEFWWFALFAALVGSALGALNIATADGMIAIGSSLASAWSVVVLLPTLAAMVRRLRDAGRQWGEVFWLLVPIAGLIVLAIHLSEPSKTGDAKAGSAGLGIPSSGT
ncbi:DUF805 domain-containing protein [Pseudarthrobacter sp. P1]|uniref:DUF805 domain-containing protein n=1 Tax=Pseudarthrobacter sp. P1 TaxID=3418418 RepID=UPI003CFB25F0